MKHRAFLFLFAFTCISLAPLLAHAAPPAQDYVQRYTPLTLDTIPGIKGADAATHPTLVEYLNAVFAIVISVGATVAVVRIVLEGFRYMMTDAWGNKEEAKGNITAILTGLVVLLLSTIILRTINPDLINLDIFRFK